MTMSTDMKINPWYEHNIPEGMSPDPIVLRLLKLFLVTDEEYQILKESFGKYYTGSDYVLGGL